MANRIGSVKLLAQLSFALKPMIEEAVIPSKATKSTYSSYLRKVTSYVASWTGCVSMKLLRRYRKKDEAEWIKLYKYCLSRTILKQAHLYLGTAELAALCGVMKDADEINTAIKPVTNKRF